MHHAPESIAGKLWQRKEPETVSQQDRQLRRNDGDRNVQPKRKGGKARQQANDDQQPSRNFDPTHKWSHDIGHRDSNTGETPSPKLVDEQELLDALGKEYSAYEEAYQHC
jgi:hypothetical protein